MKPIYKKALLTFVLALTVTISVAFYIYLNTARIVIYYTNDIHGWIMPQEAKHFRPLGQKGKSEIGKMKNETKRNSFMKFFIPNFSFHPSAEGSIGGFATLANYLKEKPKGYLLVDGGDFFQGTPEGDLTKGDSVIECMNALGYYCAALGNHEFDLGEDNIKRLSRIAKFPFLSANIYDVLSKTRDEKSLKRINYAQTYLIREIGGVKVAVVGLITSKTKEIVLSRNVEHLYFKNETETLKKIVQELKGQGVQVIVVAAHVGLETKDSPSDFEGEKFLAASVPGIHLVLGGHSHFELKKPYRDKENKTLIVHNQSGLKTVTRIMLRVWKKDGKLFCYSHKLIPLEVEKYGEDPEVKKIVGFYQKQVGEKMDVVIGKSQMLLDKKGDETLLGNWQTDLMKQFSKSDFAFQNAGGIRADLPQGNITLRHLYLLSPFENTIVTMDLKGEQVKEILEHSISGSQGILQVSGLKVVFDKTMPKGQMVREITVGDRLIDMNKNYKVATNNFLADGGDGFITFKDGKNVKDTMMTLRDLEIEFVKKNSPISAKIEGRISIVQR